MKPKEVLERAALTFAEAALVVLVAAEAGFVNVEAWKAAALAGGAAVLSFALNEVRRRRGNGGQAHA